MPKWGVGARLFVGFGLAIGAFVAFLYVFDGAAMARELEDVALLPFVAGLGAVVLSVACWGESMRRVLLASGGDIGASRAAGAYGTGMLAKQIVPLGNAGGVPIMAYAIDREVGIGYNRSLAVVTVGDFIGLLASLVLAVLGVAAVVLTAPATRLLQAAFVAVALFGALVIGVGVLLVYRRPLLRRLVLGIAYLLRGLARPVSATLTTRLGADSVGRSLDRYFETLDTVRSDRRSIAIATAIALVGWTAFTVPLYTSSLAVGHPIPFAMVLFIVPLGGVATLVPLPGGLGGVEFAVGGLLVAMTGMGVAVAGAVVLLYRLTVYWFLILLGVLAAIYTGTTVSELQEGVQRISEPEAGD